ncbi:hypothetical protein [Psychrilyobacter sp.]|uniref:hypothetical protein n=1 Tax=Psychrilyobacter sp. TaxID=2586924 RepID=UPI003017079B
MKKDLKKSYALFDMAGSLENSKLEIIKKDLKEIETKIITYGHSDEKWEISSLDHISLPFFTRKKNKKVNLVYKFTDFGIKMYCNITSQEKNIQQPSEFEESIFEFVIQKSFEIYKGESLNIENEENLSFEIKEKLKENIINNIEINFTIEELLNYLKILKSQSIYTKVEKALNNMKFTEYYFETENSKKAKQSNYIFETDTFKLLNYQKFKDGRKIYYKIMPSATLLQRALQNKNYLYFTESSRKDISKYSRSALRIFRYIAKKRFAKTKDTSLLEALAMVVPYEVETKITKKTKYGEKDYYTCRRKEVNQRIEEHMKLLVELGYLKEYKSIYHGNKVYEFSYVFGEKMGIITTYTLKLNEKNKLKLDNQKQKSMTLPLIKNNPDRIEKEIEKVKRNIFVSKAWNKRVDNEIKNLLDKEGEEYTIFLLKTIYKNLKQDITTTLVQYINGVSKRIPNENFERPVKKEVKLPKNNAIIEAEIVEETKVQSGTNEMLDLIYTMYLDMKTEKQQIIKEKAIENYMKFTGGKKFTSVHEKIFKTIEKNYIVKVIKDELGGLNESN